MASEWKCSVLSNDSDFFIFDIKGGYIPLFSLDSDNLTARIFYRSELARHFGIRDELLPLFASLLGNDYLSWDVLKPFNSAVWNLYRDGRSGKEARFLRVASMLSQLCDSITEKQAFQFALNLVAPGESREELKQAVEYSLQEYTVLNENLLYYFQAGVVCSFLRTQSNLEIEEEVLRRFREGKFSTNCMSSLTAGKVFLKVQVEDPEKRSANQCSKSLRQFVYGILNNGGRNIEKIEEWDREGSIVKNTDIKPYSDGVPRLSCILNVDLNNRLMMFLDALHSNTANIKSLPKEFTLIAASLRFLVSNAQPPLETNRLAALLCSCVKLADGSWKQYLENARGSSPQPFNVQAAQRFCQWQCVLRDAVHLNFLLFEPVQTPCIAKTFNGRLVHCLQEELNHGKYLPGNKTFLILTLFEHHGTR